MNDNFLIIVIPIYKSDLEWYENISLMQLSKILGKYPIAIVAPESLVFDFYSIISEYSVIRFPDKYFKSRQTYSELLLSESFYICFEKYKYMLVYQTDAFVFYDAVDRFISMNYDYIGAPVYNDDFELLNCSVGNGGFSLRKIKNTIKLLKNEKDLLCNSEFSELFHYGEDLFFSFCGHNKDIRFKTPTIKIASSFSTEWNIGHALDKISKKGLPMGTHWWHIINYGFWKPYIEKYGYNLPEEDEHKSLSTFDCDNRWTNTHFIKRYKKKLYKNKIEWNPSEIFGRLGCVWLWGAGRAVEKHINIINQYNVSIIGIYDSYTDCDTCVMGVQVNKPDKGMLLLQKNSVIIISTNKYRKEISERLESWGLIEKEDFYCLGDYEKALMECYFQKCK